jgi:hypothetical protein
VISQTDVILLIGVSQGCVGRVKPPLRKFSLKNLKGVNIKDFHALDIFIKI